MANRYEKLTVLPAKMYIDKNTYVPFDSLTDEQLRQRSAAKAKEIEKIVNNDFAIHPQNAEAWCKYHQGYLDMCAEENKKKKTQRS